MIRITLMGVALLAWSLGALAGKPYIEHEYQYTQPNGDVVTIILNGDDYFAEQHSLTGELVMYDGSVGGMVYAEVNADRTELISTGELVASSDFAPYANRYIRRRGRSTNSKESDSKENKDKKLDDKQQQQQVINLAPEQQLLNRASQIPESVTGLSILIQFPDESSDISKAQVDNFLNGTNYSEFGNAASVKGYFDNVSNGHLDYSNTVTQFYTAQNNKAYYTDDDHDSTIRSRELILEALNWLEHTQGFDFSTLTTDADGNILGLNMFYAGQTDSAWSRGLWPHMGKLIPNFCADGVCTDRYQITNLGQQLELGPFVHETAHLLYRWPDLFDYDASSFGSVANFGLMGFGGTNTETKHSPVPPNGYYRYLAGWITAIELNPLSNPDANEGEYSHDAGSDIIYRWSNPNNLGEAFYIEQIDQTGHNQHQPDSGLAIWHTNPEGSHFDESQPFVQFEQADGNRDLENLVNRGDDTDLFSSGAFGFNAPNSDSANSRWLNGNDSGLSLHSIAISGSTATFKVGDETGQAEPEVKYQSSGHLNQNEIAVEPYGSWFYTYGGDFSFELEGSNETDFDLYLQYWNGYEWIFIAASQSYSSSESIQYNLSQGYYRLLVHAYNGAGNYLLTIN